MQEMNSWNEVEQHHFDEEDEEEELVYLVSIIRHILLIFECQNLMYTSDILCSHNQILSTVSTITMLLHY